MDWIFLKSCNCVVSDHFLQSLPRALGFTGAGKERFLLEMYSGFNALTDVKQTFNSKNSLSKLFFSSVQLLGKRDWETKISVQYTWLEFERSNNWVLKQPCLMRFYNAYYHSNKILGFFLQYCVLFRNILSITVLFSLSPVF